MRLTTLHVDILRTGDNEYDVWYNVRALLLKILRPLWPKFCYGPYHFIIFLILLANGTNEADGDGNGDKTDAQGNNTTTKVYYHLLFYKMQLYLLFCVYYWNVRQLI